VLLTLSQRGYPRRGHTSARSSRRLGTAFLRVIPPGGGSTHSYQVSTPRFTVGATADANGMCSAARRGRATPAAGTNTSSTSDIPCCLSIVAVLLWPPPLYPPCSTRAVAEAPGLRILCSCSYLIEQIGRVERRPLARLHPGASTHAAYPDDRSLFASRPSLRISACYGHHSITPWTP